MVAGTDGGHRFDHVVSVMFENRSFDNLLGYLYDPGEVASFEGVAGRHLSNPIPNYAPDAERGLVPVHVATSMDAPNPDAGEEHPHTNTQLFGTVAPEDNRFLSYEAMQPPFNAPDDPGREPTMDGFVLDYVNTFRSETGRLPDYDEYAQIMSCYAPEQVPVISTIAKGFATFDHWFCEVPSQTFTNRSFYHAASASGLVVNPPYDSFPQHNDAETIFERLDAAGRSWRVYVDPGMPFSITGMLHTPRLSKQFATHFSTLDDFFADAEQGRLPIYSFIEPNLLHAHNDYHPAMNAVTPGLAADPPSSILGGEALLARIYSAIRGSSTADGSNFANTLFLVGFDEHGGTYDHVPPPRVPPPNPAAGAGQMGFRFDRSGVRIPTLAVSAYLDPRTVVTGEYRNTSLIRTLRERFSLGPPLTGRDAVAADIAPSSPAPPPAPRRTGPRSPPPRCRPWLTRWSPWTSHCRRSANTSLGTAIALDAMHTGQVPDIDPKTATGQQARDYMLDGKPESGLA
jgi:phospholipase C